MKPRLTSLQKFIRILPLIFLVVSLPMPLAVPAQAETVQVTIEDPQLHPAYTTCLTSYWYQFDNNRGHKAYLTLNVHDPADSTNSGEWHPAIPQTGYYRVEAYIPAHGPIAWCSSGNIKDHDTTNARYTIHHAYGETTVAKSQYPLSNQWLNLGEFYFTAGSAGYVSLVDLNGETAFTTTVSFSAMRFTFTVASRPGANGSDASGVRSNKIPLVSRTSPYAQAATTALPTIPITGSSHDQPQNFPHTKATIAVALAGEEVTVMHTAEFRNETKPKAAPALELRFTSAIDLIFQKTANHRTSKASSLQGSCRDPRARRQSKV